MLALTEMIYKLLSLSKLEIIYIRKTKKNTLTQNLEKIVKHENFHKKQNKKTNFIIPKQFEG
jgi:hypothetical protein